MFNSFFKGVSEYLAFLFQGFGFSGTNDFMESAFHISSWKPLAIVSISVGSLGLSINGFFQNNLGLAPFVYLSFLLLIVIETWTGIQASLKKGRKVQSRKLVRMLIKISIYTIIIGILQQFATGLSTPNIPFTETKINIYTWIYFVVLNWIVLQLILSVLENLSEMGWEETNGLFKIIYNKISKWFQLQNED